MNVPTLVQADPGYFPGVIVSHAVQLQPLSLLGLYDAPVEKPDHHCIPLSLGTGAACGQNSAMSPQVLLGKSSWGLWAGLFPAGVVWSVAGRQLGCEGECGGRALVSSTLECCAGVPGDSVLRALGS